MDDKEFLKSAIKQSELSVKEGRFPAGAIIVLDNEVLTSEISDIHPGYQHSECKAIDKAFEKVGDLSNATLYASMEPCLMCLSRAYWAGIRKIVFAISRKKVPKEYYEGVHENKKLVETFNEEVALVHIEDLEEEAIKIVRTWNK